MAMNGVYNYNNYVMGGKKYNSPNENGINMAMVHKGRFYESMESSGNQYYGVSYTAEMQKEGKIGIPDDKVPGKYRIVDVDSDEGKARLAELEKERADALAELKKYNEFRNPPPANTPAETKPAKTGDNSGIVNDVKPKSKHYHAKTDIHHAGTYTKNGIDSYKPVYDYSRAEKRERAFAKANGLDYDLAMRGRMYESYEKLDTKHPLFKNREDYDKAITEWNKLKELKAADGEATKKAKESQPAKEHYPANLMKGKYRLSGRDMDKLREVRDGMRGNVSAFKQMVQAHAKAQAQHAKKAGKDSGFKDMMGDISKITPAQAQSAISEDGEWGVKKTAERLLNFAIALSGGDPDKIGVLRDAVQKGFNAAAKVWGGALPGICHDTLKKVMDGFDEWARTGSAQSAQALMSA